MKIFCRTRRKSIRGEPSNVLKYFGYRTFFCKKRTYHFFSLKSFLPHNAEKKIVGEPFCVTENSSLEDFHALEKWGHHGIVEKSFVSQDRHKKHCNGIVFFYKKLLVSTKLYWVRARKNKMAMLLSETANVSEVAKRSHTAEIRTPIYRFRTLLSQPHCLHFFFSEKLRQFWTEQKKKNNPTEWKLFRAYYESGGKN